MKPRIIRSIAWLLFALASSLPVAAQSLPTMELAINGHHVTAEVAATEETRTTGLMRRFSLRPDHGMLFVFEQPQQLAFWMKNTYIPLSIAFIGTDGRIINIEDMAPLTEMTHDSRGPAIYALEMKKGWFAQLGIKPGDKVDGLASIPNVSK